MPIISSSSPDHSLRDLVEKVRSFGTGLGSKDDRVAYLSSDISSTDTTIQVDDASPFSAGWVEIGLELIRIKSVDKTSNLITLAPGGRGYRGTTAAQHLAGSEVLFTPTLPRSTVTNEINREIAGMYPLITGVDSVEATITNVAQPAYEIPSDAEAVLDVRWRDLVGYWHRVNSWETEFGVNALDFPSGQCLRLGQMLQAGTTVQIVYAKRPKPLTGLDDPFSSTGLPDGVVDVVELGTLLRLLPAFDMGRLSSLTISENDVASQRIRLADGGTVISREIKAQYQFRLANERQAFAKKYPPRLHRVS